jgi:hypothetical protein
VENTGWSDGVDAHNGDGQAPHGDQLHVVLCLPPPASQTKMSVSLEVELPTPVMWRWLNPYLPLGCSEDSHTWVVLLAKSWHQSPWLCSSSSLPGCRNKSIKLTWPFYLLQQNTKLAVWIACTIHSEKLLTSFLRFHTAIWWSCSHSHVEECRVTLHAIYETSIKRMGVWIEIRLSKDNFYNFIIILWKVNGGSTTREPFLLTIPNMLLSEQFFFFVCVEVRHNVWMKSSPHALRLY